MSLSIVTAGEVGCTERPVERGDLGWSQEWAKSNILLSRREGGPGDFFARPEVDNRPGVVRSCVHDRVYMSRCVVLLLGREWRPNRGRSRLGVRGLDAGLGSTNISALSPTPTLETTTYGALKSDSNALRKPSRGSQDLNGHTGGLIDP